MVLLILLSLKIEAATFSLVPDPDNTPPQAALKEIIDIALSGHNAMVQEAWSQSRGLYKAQGDEIEFVMQKVQEAISGKNPIEIKDKVLESLNREAEKFIVFDASLAGLYAKGEVLLQLYCNTVLDSVKGVIGFTHRYFEDVWHGTLPEGYDIKVADDYCITFDDPKTIYGTSKGTALKSALLHLLLALYEKATLADLRDVLGEGWLDTSAFVHLTPIPPSLELGEIASSAYLFQDATGRFLANVHNGYVLGGQRSEPRYLEHPKAQGPEDCSSWIGKYIFNDDILRTRHLFYAYCLQTGQEGRVSEISRAHSIVQKSVMAFEPATLTDPLKDITAGQVYAYRKMGEDKEGVGERGHTGVILGRNEAGVLMLERARWCHKDGFALRWYKYADPTDDRYVMVFNIRSS